MMEPLGSGARDARIWGPNYWISIQDYRPVSASEIKPYFTSLAEREYKLGARNFYVEVDATKKDQIQEWFELGFGLQHVSALLTVFAPEYIPAAVTIRRPTISDIPAIAILEQSLSLHQNESPVFSQLKADSIEDIEQEWSEDINNPELFTFIAELNGEVVGLAYGCSTEKSRLHSEVMRPENSATLAFCAVLPDFRGQGIGKAIASSVIDDLYKNGFETIVTDWRATNQLSSVTWPKLGFTPTLFRLHRAL